MDIILSPGFGTCLRSSEPRPGLANDDLARQIFEHVEQYGREQCLIITAEPVTIALNTCGIYPDLNVPTVGRGRGNLQSKDFLEAVFERLQPRINSGDLSSLSCEYFVAAQWLQVGTLIRLLWTRFNVHAEPLSQVPLRTDRDSEPPFTRSLGRFWIHERILSPLFGRSPY
jgi:hypothetical protein